MDSLVWGTLAAAGLARFMVGLSSYSGESDPPMYGDYEAQRHWMEVTTHLPLQHWYAGGPSNNLSYWGLDYPPLTAYQSWLYGKVIGQLEPPAIALQTSHGYETPSSKLLMRWSVVASDIAVLLPALMACSAIFHAACKPSTRAWLLAVSLLQPAALLIDHGHFQYNGISLGLAAGAAAAVAGGRHLLGSFLYCCALNHKQMAMYYAPAFFGHLLGTCLQRPGMGGKVVAVARLAVVVLLTFAVLWAPFAAHDSKLASRWQTQGVWAVLQRLVPLQRGLFEDYVANMWCATQTLVKWKRLLSLQAQVRACMLCTVAAAAPSMVHQMLRPSRQGLLYALANSAFAFYLFSFQVHEKSILLPLLPVTLLAHGHPGLAMWLCTVATFSMFPLLKKDGLSLAYAASLLMWAGIALLQPSLPQAPRSTGQQPVQQVQASQGSENPPLHVAGQHPSGAGTDTKQARRYGPPLQAQSQQQRRNSALYLSGAMTLYTSKLGMVLTVLAAAVIHVLQSCVPAPAKLRFLYDAAIVSLSFANLLPAAVYLNICQWQL